MKVTAAKTMPRSCVRAPATRGARIATRMSAGKKTTSKVSNQVAAAAALTALTASAPALAAVNEVGQVAGAEFLPSVLVRSCDTKPTRSTERVKSTADRSPRSPPPPLPTLRCPSWDSSSLESPWPLPSSTSSPRRSERAVGTGRAPLEHHYCNCFLYYTV